MTNKIQDKWNDSSILGMDSIVLKNGLVYLIDIIYSQDDRAKKTFNKLYQLEIGAKTSLDELLENDPDVWSEIQINGELELHDNSKILFGEGEMGNEGFIVKTDAENNIEWSFFSTQSNPFINATIVNEDVHIFSSHGFHMILNKDDDPIKMIIDNNLS